MVCPLERRRSRRCQRCQRCQRCRRWPLLLLLLLLAVATDASRTAEDVPSEAARRAAVRIRREALLPPHGPEGRPLPLASHWNVGTVPGTFDADHQIALLQAGHAVLPWLAWPAGDPSGDRFRRYHERLLGYFRRLGLPISIRGTQWSAMLLRRPYREGPPERWAGVIAPDGRRVPVLSPFGPVAPWKDPADEYVATAAMRRAQELYPDPPLVLWVSNNEPPELRWKKHGSLEEQSRRYLEIHGPGRPDEYRRRVVGEGWIERYRVLFEAMRRALDSDAWRRSVRFVGYGAFGPSHLGRWDGWPVYSLHCDRWMSPDWHVWDGASPSYYTHDWNECRDDRVFSTQVESMNWLCMLDEAWKANPAFWFELSTWDGNDVAAWSRGVGAQGAEDLVARSSRELPAKVRRLLRPDDLKRSQALRYLAEGQTFPPSRVAGWVQFGMWLLRPRVVREFRSHSTPLAPVEPYWLETVRAVDRVHSTPLLARFWRHADLVRVPTGRHPYQAAVPERLRGVSRWYLLDSDALPPRPWTLWTELPVFSLALVLRPRGEPDEVEHRRWLVYAHAPRGSLRDVRIEVPEFGEIRVDVPRGGGFWEVDEATRAVRPVAPSPLPPGEDGGSAARDGNGQPRSAGLPQLAPKTVSVSGRLRRGA